MHTTSNLKDVIKLPTHFAAGSLNNAANDSSVEEGKGIPLE
jgi:hypothetical protein